MSILLGVNVVHLELFIGKLLWGFRLHTVLSKKENQIRPLNSSSRKINFIDVFHGVMDDIDVAVSFIITANLC